MYTVKFRAIENANTIQTRKFETQGEAINFYKRNMRNMLYGYISDEEALETAEDVMNEAEAIREERIHAVEDFAREVDEQPYMWDFLRP